MRLPVDRPFGVESLGRLGPRLWRGEPLQMAGTKSKKRLEVMRSIRSDMKFMVQFWQKLRSMSWLVSYHQCRRRQEN